MSKRRKMRLKYLTFTFIPIVLLGAIFLVYTQAGATTATQWPTVRGYIDSYFNGETGAAGGDEAGLIYPKLTLRDNLGATGANETLLASYAAEGTDMKNKPVLIDNLMTAATAVPGTEFRCNWSTDSSCFSQTSLNAVKAQVDAHAAAGFSTDIVDYCQTSHTATPTTAGWGIIAQTGALESGSNIPKVYELKWSRNGWNDSGTNLSPTSDNAQLTGAPEAPGSTSYSPTFPVTPTGAGSCEANYTTDPELVRCLANWAISSTGGNVGNGQSTIATIAGAGQSIDVRPGGSITTMSTATNPNNNIQLPLDTLFSDAGLGKVDPTKSIIVASNTQHGGQAAMGLKMLGYNMITGGYINGGIARWAYATGGERWSADGHVLPFEPVATLTAGPGTLVDTSGTACTGACTGPAISGSETLSGITATGATLSGWTTNKPTTVRVEYGTTTSYGSNAYNTVLHADHSGANGVTLSGLSESTHYFYRITDYDSNANASTTQLTGEFTTADVTNPTVNNPSPADGAKINNASPTVSADYSDAGSGIKSSTAGITLDSTAMTGCIMGDSSISCPASSLSEGSHTAVASVQDNSGNTGTLTWSFTVDTVAPVVSNPSPADNSWVNASNPTLSADYTDATSGIDSSSASIKVDGTDATGCTADATHVSCPTSGLSEGSRSVEALVSDNAGNQGTLTWTIKVDTTAPTTNDDAPTGWQSSDVTVNLACDDGSGSGCAETRYSTDGGTTWTVGGTVVVSTSGTTTIKYYSVDNATNVESIKTVDVQLDKATPSITNVQPASGSTVGANTTISADYSDADSGIDSSTVSVSLDSTDITGSCTVAAGNVSCPVTGLSDASHSVTVAVSDNAGNPTSHNWAFTVNAAAPLPDPGSYTPANGSIITNAQPAVSLNYTPGSNPVDGVTINIDGVGCTPVTWDQASASCTPAAPLDPPDGTHNVHAVISAGTASNTADWSFNVDTLPPDISSIVPNGTITTNNADVAVYYSDLGSSVDTTTVVVTWDGTALTDCVATAAYVSCPQTVLPQGSHTIGVSLSDMSGHATTGSGGVFIDSIAPRLTSMIPRTAINNASPDLTADIADGAIRAVWPLDADSGINNGSIQVTMTPPGGTETDITAGCTITDETPTDANEYARTHVACTQSSLAEGVYSWKVSVADNAGNTYTRVRSFTVDTTAPTITSITPGGNLTTADADVAVYYNDGTGSGINTAAVAVYWDDDNITASCGVYADFASCPQTGLPQGAHTVTAWVADKATNTVTSTSGAIFIDSLAPRVSNIKPRGSSTSTSAAVSAYLADGAIRAVWPLDADSGIDDTSLAVTLDSSILDGCTIQDLTPTADNEYARGYVTCPQVNDLAEGAHTINITIKDNFGNSKTGSRTFNVDLTGPTISNVQPTGSIASSPTTIQADYSDALAGINTASAKVYLDGSLMTGCTATATHISCPATDVAAGLHNVDVYVNDNATNPAHSATTFTSNGPSMNQDDYVYYLPWYDTTGGFISGTWINMAYLGSNSNGVDVDIWVQGAFRQTLHLNSGENQNVIYGNFMGGPVGVRCRHCETSGDHLTVAERSLYQGSFNETMAVEHTEDPAGTSHLATAYAFPWYDNKNGGFIGDWIMVTNADPSSVATVQIYVGDMNTPAVTYTINPRSDVEHPAQVWLPAGGAIANGPVKIVSVNGQKIVATQRVLYLNSFNETFGNPIS